MQCRLLTLLFEEPSIARKEPRHASKPEPLREQGQLRANTLCPNPHPPLHAQEPKPIATVRATYSRSWIAQSSNTAMGADGGRFTSERHVFHDIKVAGAAQITGWPLS